MGAKYPSRFHSLVGLEIAASNLLTKLVGSQTRDTYLWYVGMNERLTFNVLCRSLCVRESHTTW